MLINTEAGALIGQQRLGRWAAEGSWLWQACSALAGFWDQQIAAPRLHRSPDRLVLPVALGKMLQDFNPMLVRLCAAKAGSAGNGFPRLKSA